MKRLESKWGVSGKDGVTPVELFDGDVDYIFGSTYHNPCYYRDKNFNGGKRKTRPYAQWTGMKVRAMDSYTKRYGAYEGVTIHEHFKNFDNWCEWARDKSGFMCVDNGGYIYQLDKDFKNPEAKMYSPENCCFVPPYVNSFANITTFDSAMSFMDRFLEDDFQTIDEDVIEYIVDLWGFDFALSNQKRYSPIELEILNRMCALLTRFTSMDVLDTNANIIFQDGVFTLVCMFDGEKFKYQSEDHVDTYRTRLLKFKTYLEKIFSGGEFSLFEDHHTYKLSQAKYNEICETLTVLDDDFESIRHLFKKWVVFPY